MIGFLVEKWPESADSGLVLTIPQKVSSPFLLRQICSISPNISNNSGR